MKGSSNRQRIKVAQIHERIINCPNRLLAKGYCAYCQKPRHHCIAMEDLQVLPTMKDHNLAKAISEVSWYPLRTLLEYKASSEKLNLWQWKCHFLAIAN